jgi:hypothetical protein
LNLLSSAALENESKILKMSNQNLAMHVLQKKSPFSWLAQLAAK